MLGHSLHGMVFVVKNSVITGAHRTKVGSHEAVALIVEADNSIPTHKSGMHESCFSRSSGFEPGERNHLSKKNWSTNDSKTSLWKMFVVW